MGFQDQGMMQQGPAGTIDVVAELRRLEKMTERLRLIVEPPQAGRPGQITTAKLREMIKARRMREQLLGNDLFADPAWDILLEAYFSEMTQMRLSISSLCIGAAVPATTALRWVSKLEQEGWLWRQDDPTDARRSWIKLTDEGSRRLTAYFEAISGGFAI